MTAHKLRFFVVLITLMSGCAANGEPNTCTSDPWAHTYSIEAWRCTESPDGCKQSQNVQNFDILRLERDYLISDGRMIPLNFAPGKQCADFDLGAPIDSTRVCVDSDGLNGKLVIGQDTWEFKGVSMCPEEPDYGSYLTWSLYGVYEVEWKCLDGCVTGSPLTSKDRLLLEQDTALLYREACGVAEEGCNNIQGAVQRRPSCVTMQFESASLCVSSCTIAPTPLCSSDWTTTIAYSMPGSVVPASAWQMTIRAGSSTSIASQPRVALL